MSLYAVIGGSGLYQPLTDDNKFISQYVDTPLGTTSSPLVHCEWAGCPVVFLTRHGSDHQIPPHKINYRANLWALKHAGVTHVIAVNAVGGISSEFFKEALCVPDQIIDYTYGREHTFSTGNSPVEHVDFTFPYSDSVRLQLIEAAKTDHITLQNTGVYGCTQGPRLETAAEIKRLAGDGCDMVGMTGMPEAALARELNLEYASIALVVNRAAGLSQGLIDMADIKQVLNNGMAKIKALISTTLAQQAIKSL